MKKLMLSVLSCLTLCTLAMPINALDSVGSESVNTNNVLVDGKPVDKDKVVVNVTEVNSKEATDLNGGKNLETVITEDKLANGSKDVDLSQYTLASKVVDLNITIDNNSAQNVTVTLEVPSVKAGDTVKVLHYVNGAWEVLNATAGDGTVTCTFSSLSPIGVIVKKAAPVANNDKPASKPASGYDDGGPFTTDACGNVFDRWGNEIYHSPVCVNNGSTAGNTYTFVNTSDR